MINAMMTVNSPSIAKNPCIYKLDLTGSKINQQWNVFIGGYHPQENIGKLTPTTFFNSNISSITWVFSNGFRGTDIAFTKKLPFKYFLLTFGDIDHPAIVYDEQNADNISTSTQLLQMPIEQQIPIAKHLIANYNKVINIKLQGFE